MPEQNNNIAINGIPAFNKLESSIRKKINFGFNELDDANEINNALNIIKNDLLNYNSIIVQSQKQEQSKTQEEVKEPPLKKTE